MCLPFPIDSQYSQWIKDEPTKILSHRSSSRPQPYLKLLSLTSFLPQKFEVDGKTWPSLEVEPRKDRFRLLNGSDSRFYTLTFATQPGKSHSSSTTQPFQQIGTDQGLLDSPLRLRALTIAPGERADIVIDFSKLRGKTLILRNSAVAPFPDGEQSDRHTTGEIMAFRVTKPLSGPDTSEVPKRLRPDDMPPS